MSSFLFRRQRGILTRRVCDGQHAGTELIWKAGVISKSGFTLSNNTEEGQGVGEGGGSVFAEHAN